MSQRGDRRSWLCNLECAEDRARPKNDAPTLGDVIAARFNRRDVLGGLLATSAIALTGCATRTAELPLAASAKAAQRGSATFAEVPHGVDGNHHVAAGYDARPILRWGDAMVEGLDAFDPLTLTADEQEQRFGYNCDFIGLVPLSSDRVLLCVNHEYTIASLMFPGLLQRSHDPRPYVSKDQMAVEMAAHGGSIVELRRVAGAWAPVTNSRFNRRISLRSTAMRVSGPAAGHPRLRTAADPTGTEVIGTMGNCAGGITPWGTYLMAEENINGYFTGALPEGHPEAANHARMSVPSSWYFWGNEYARFDIGKTPNEPNRFGWIVEVDPKDPSSKPVKRTALGRFKHEGAETVVAPDGRVVVYSGDDERFDYVYKFVSARRFDANNRVANRELLDTGTLYVARFHTDGTVAWLPLLYDQGPLTPANGFSSQADVMIETRRAADLLGATPMDRPEDVQPETHTGRVYVMLTNNDRRTDAQVDAANPRANNDFGHIIEIIEPDGDFAATRSRWEVLLLAGRPEALGGTATFHSATSNDGWFSSPDNAAIDPLGRLWVATDQGSKWGNTGIADGLYAIATDGEARGTSRKFFRAPVGAEVAGPRFTDDGETLFVSVQHPGADGTTDYAEFERVSSFDDPATRWPDFAPGMPPRPSVVMITKQGGGKIGS